MTQDKEFKEMDERVIAHKQVHKRIMGTHAGGLLLSQLLHWSKIMKHKQFYKTDLDLRIELDMGKKQFANSKKKIMSSRIFTCETKGTPPKTNYLIDLTVLEELITGGKKHAPKGGKGEVDTREREKCKHAKGRSANTPKGEDIYRTKNTTKTTTKTITKEINKENPAKQKDITLTTPPSSIDLAVDCSLSDFDPEKNVLIEAESTYSNNETKQAKKPERTSVEKQFDEFWQNYPLKEAKGKARVPFARALKKTSLSRILEALRAQKIQREISNRLGVFIKGQSLPSSWLNGEEWDNGIKTEDELKKQALVEMRSKITYGQAKAEQIKANRSPEMVRLDSVLEERMKLGSSRESVRERLLAITTGSNKDE